MALPYHYFSGQGPVRDKARIGNITAGLMIGLALIVDSLQFFLSLFAAVEAIGWGVVALAWFVSFLAFIIFGFWFFICRVNYFTGKKAALRLIAVFSTFVLEIMPIIQALPATTAGVIAVIVTSRIEDLAGKGAHLENLSPARKTALAEGVFRGRHVRDDQANAVALAQMQRQAQEFSARASRMRVDGMSNPGTTPKRYGQLGQNDALSFVRGQKIKDDEAQ